MRWTFKIGKILNIPIRIHILFVFLLIFIWYVNTSRRGFGHGILSTVLILLVFIFVVLHELAHSYQAMKYGIKVREIVLLPIGGVAHIEKFPEKPFQEIKVAIAGPLLNFISSGIIFIIFLISGRVEYLMGYSITSTNIIKSLFWINLTLGIFNLIPAFPMDGGRILRGIFALKMPYVKATRLAASIGQSFALLFGFIGLFFNWWLILIAIFIFMGAGSEEHIVQIRTGLEGIIVRQIMSEHLFHFSPEDTLRKGLQYVYQGCRDDFPVLEDSKLVGVITRENLMAAIHQYGLDKKVKEVMDTEFQTASPDEKVSDVYLKLSQTKTKAIPVVENEEVIGMIGMDNIGRYISILTEIDKS